MYITSCKSNTFGLNSLQRFLFPRIFACGTLVLLRSASTSLPLKNLCFGVNVGEWPTLRSCIYFFATSVSVLLLRKIVVCFSTDYSVLNDSEVVRTFLPDFGAICYRTTSLLFLKTITQLTFLS